VLSTRIEPPQPASSWIYAVVQVQGERTEQLSFEKACFATLQLVLPKQAALALFSESGWWHEPWRGIGHSLGLP
jgi:hypothetical protein